MTKNLDNLIMIHRFLVNNFHSIREDAELDFRIPGTSPERPYFQHSCSRLDVRIPSVVALVGPNGSGKTALLRALIGDHTICGAFIRRSHPFRNHSISLAGNKSRAYPFRNAV